MYDPARYSPQPPAPLRQGMAIASMVIGIVSMVTCGGLCIGPILALIFGIVALTRASREPSIFGGKGMAIAGIVMSLVSPIFLGIGAIGVPNMLKSRQLANEVSAISTLRMISTAEATYQSTRGKNRFFADLGTLGSEGLISADLASGQKSGYQFAATAFGDGVETAAEFDATAVPLTTGNFGTGERSFGTNETYVIFWAPGAILLKGTARDRIPATASVLR
jgi:hypothetical protein